MPDFLNTIAWPAVPIAPSNEPLGQLMEVVEVPRVTVLTGLMAAQHRPLRRAVLVACDPQQRLVHHVDEVRYIFSKLGLDDLVLLTDQPRAITRDALISELQRADIFHFAGHGSFIPEK